MSERSSGTVEVTYTLGDIYAVTFQSWRWHLTWVLAIPAFLLAALVAIPVATVGKSIADATASVPWVFVAGIAGFLLLVRAVISPLTGYLDARREGGLGPTRFELTHEGVRIQTRDGKSLLYWSAVKQVKATRNRLFLFTDKAVGFVLPSRAFGGTAQFHSTIDEANARWKSAHQ